MGLLDTITGDGLGSGLLSLGGGILSNASSSKEAKKNRELQYKLATRAHQYEVQDLKAAGLNPILSAGGNGISVPNFQMPQIKDVVTPAVSSAQHAKRTSAEVQNMVEMNKNLRVSNEKIQSDTALNQVLSKAAMADAFLKTSTAQNQAVQNQLLKHQLPKAAAEAKANNSWVGRNIYPHTDRFFESIGKMFGGGNSAKSFIAK